LGSPTTHPVSLDAKQGALCFPKASFFLSFDHRDKIQNHGDLTYDNILVAYNVFWQGAQVGVSPTWRKMMTDTSGLLAGKVAVWNNIFGPYFSDDEPIRQPIR